ncbi:purine and uridine phosphorylase [Aspergillus sclerotioniger CBS 115572]|uniref:Purine and uridine phosphorylase n=1 Tax=Aspergillus sclerotioniger CBS 115572 TaxID=1450535 RepID=A0A317X8Z6_9EURO|nr:purine and uridine phosphorylase [Aspergillus sclerotioniger CBS 115572]PWY94661.1 purine and uridine phosphorylase [Aspergillus sclerotioniger CBS 115572]
MRAILTAKILSHDDYKIGWICALPLEMAAAQTLLDEVHEDLPVQPNDHNAYTLGAIGKHNIVIACLPSGDCGNTFTTVSMQLLSSFRSIQYGLVVGIGEGVPRKDMDIRRGDIVVSKPTATHGGVIQYDFGKVLSGSVFQQTGMLNRPPQIFLTALSKLQTHHLLGRKLFMDILSEIEQVSSFTRPRREDKLFLAGYDHLNTKSSNCDDCDVTKVIERPPRNCEDPVIHYGTIVFVNQANNSWQRDRLGSELDAYCVESGGAGFMNNFPCLIIRGISDYADSHRTKDWQGYAAATAAAYAKELLLASVIHVDQTQTVQKPSANSELVTVAQVKDLLKTTSCSEAVAAPAPAAAFSYDELSGVYLGTIRGQEIIPRLIRNPDHWRKKINVLLAQLIEIHPQWWIERTEESARIMNEFFTRSRLTYRVNVYPRPSERPVYHGNDREYLSILFDHNLGWQTQSDPNIGLNIGILNIWSILEFLDRGDL